MAYRGSEASDALEAPTAQGILRAELAPRAIKLTIGDRTVQIVDRVVTIAEARSGASRAKKIVHKVEGRLFVARDVPREDLGLWLEVRDEKGLAMRRIFGVEPLSLLDERGLPALALLDTLAGHLRTSLGELADDVRRAVELGRGLDKVLFADHGDRYVLYARPLFRDRARNVLEVFTDGRIEIPDGKVAKKLQIRSRFGVTLWGDFIRFANPQGIDLGRIRVPWIAPEDRIELARRIGQLVDQG